VAPQQIVIIPVVNKEETKAAVLEAARTLAAQLRAQRFHDESVRVHIDERDIPGGTKNWEWIKKGVPVRIELGPRDLEKGTVAVARRDAGVKEKTFPTMTDCVASIVETLQSIQDNLLNKAKGFREENLVKIDDKAAFEAFFTAKNPDKPEIHGGFALVHWAGTAEDEDHLQKTLGVTMRCIPRGAEFMEEGTCLFTGGKSTQRVVFAKAY
jgi:prolyl-tRNA synthetase